MAEFVSQYTMVYCDRRARGKAWAVLRHGQPSHDMAARRATQCAATRPWGACDTATRPTTRPWPQYDQSSP